jgi:hypothetical protein
VYYSTVQVKRGSGPAGAGARKDAKWEADYQRRLAEVRAEGHEGKQADMIVFGRMIADLGRAVA